MFKSCKLKRKKPLKRTPLKRRRRPIRKVSAKQRVKMEENRALCDEWWAEGKKTCGICGLQINSRVFMTVDHILPGSGKDNSRANKQPAHRICNGLKGSKRNYTREDCLRDLGLLPR